MQIKETTLQDVKIIETNVFGDHRGFFTESYSEKTFKDLGIGIDFVQDNHSFSAQAGVLRGLHFQRGNAVQTKLVRVTSGVVWDVVVDLRKGSPTYGQWEGFILSEHNHRQLLVPKGFAHGFVTLTPNVNFMYKCDAYYDAQADAGIAFDDKTIAIDWPIDIDKAILSEKDKKHPSFLAYEAENEFVYGEI
ncbi:dTDP-4-dehydrorhamnose 3,5-epimerase [Tuanshanicoccus lijuaniae]|uniref:dTDP-4-dehydrorhamnose 3,5-epimerase n=1 Tax=Aerococcaceae bacterium zg-1292 TaxID=2774330 RepID=UPI001BD87497|nr:dTDP-4-dehydrorhamnose 3,5-epimerase [Aerococcaceae bacterium zg-A91]MBS4458449.1 dTDP-4-dehydrorhamnose 3,5-epimerase [Aerococcaceae bacterium zg-BR33]